MSGSPEQPPIAELLNYSGSSTRLSEPPTNGVSIADLRSSDRNEETVDKLLSALSIPFHIERPELGWRGIPRPMRVTIAEGDYRRAMETINAALAQDALERAQEGDFSWY